MVVETNLYVPAGKIVENFISEKMLFFSSFSINEQKKISRFFKVLFYASIGTIRWNKFLLEKKKKIVICFYHFRTLSENTSAFGKINSAVLPNLQSERPEEHRDEN